MSVLDKLEGDTNTTNASNKLNSGISEILSLVVADTSNIATLEVASIN